MGLVSLRGDSQKKKKKKFRRWVQCWKCLVYEVPPKATFVWPLYKSKSNCISHCKIQKFTQHGTKNICISLSKPL